MLTTAHTLPDFAALLRDFHAAEAWMQSHIQDPAGTRFLMDHAPEEVERDRRERKERMIAFLRFLGDPHFRFRSVHIAGTGGKGSVAMLLGAILTEMGWKVGIHTSPYVQVPTEKLMINRHMIAPSEFAALVQDFRARHAEFMRLRPDAQFRYAEMWVLLAYYYFCQNRVDWGIVETGIGGRFDATNVLLPDLAIITNVDYDHVRALGPTLADIAFHKAGIIKPYVPVIVGETKPVPLEIIRQEARLSTSTAYYLNHEIQYELLNASSEGLSLVVTTPFGSRYQVNVGLRGDFQAENTALAVSAAAVIARKRGVDLTEQQINAALATVRFPGRLEQVQERPTVFIDGAHNPQKLQALVRAMARLFPGKKYTLIVGMLATKDVDKSFALLLPQVNRIYATQPDVLGKPVLPAEQLADQLRALAPGLDIVCMPHVPEAIDAALAAAAPDDIILITGSLYMLGKVRPYWFATDDLLRAAEHAMPVADRCYPSAAKNPDNPTG